MFIYEVKGYTVISTTWLIIYFSMLSLSITNNSSSPLHKLFLLACDFSSDYNIDVSLAMASISTETSLVLVLACFALVLMGGLSYKYNEHKWNNKCPRCAEKGEEVYVLPGKHCPRCNQPC